MNPFAPAGQTATTAPQGKMNGSIDSIIDNQVFAGWVLNHARIFNGRDVLVTIIANGQEIGRAHTSYPRFDIVKDADYFAGFRVTCGRAVTHDDILFGRVHAEFRDRDGATAVGLVWDNVRARSAHAILATARPLGPLAAKLMLGFLARSGAVPHADTADAKDVDVAAEPNDGKARRGMSADEWLLNQFESLGFNCAFGLIQTNAKAAHLGLMKFSEVPIEGLTAALANRMAGVGEAEYTNISVDTTGEYRTSDRRYGMSAHTKIHVGEIDEADFARRQLAKISYLVRNFLEDIEAGDKILVVHAMPDRLDAAQLAKLGEAVRKIGPAPILYVEAATEHNPPGEVRRLNAGTLIGYVRATPTQHFQSTPESLASWITVCRKAYQLAFDVDDLDAHIHRAIAAAADVATRENG